MLAYIFMPLIYLGDSTPNVSKQMKRAQGITEQLKAENALEWTQRMNNIRACARKIVEREIIFA